MASSRQINLKKWLLVGLAIIIFLTLTYRVTRQGPVLTDLLILNIFRSFNSVVLDSLSLAITQLGGALFIIGATILFAILFYIKKQLTSFYVLISSVATAAITSYSLKLLFQRGRPDLWQTLVTEKTFSFPSGHSMLSSALAFSIIFTFWHTKYRNIVTLLALLYMLSVGFTRVYLGVHYPSDIVAGWSLSFIIVVIVRSLINKHQKHTD